MWVLGDDNSFRQVASAAPGSIQIVLSKYIYQSRRESGRMMILGVWLLDQQHHLGLEVQILGLHSRPSESETLGMEPRNGLKNPPGDSDSC